MFYEKIIINFYNQTQGVIMKKLIIFILFSTVSCSLFDSNEEEIDFPSRVYSVEVDSIYNSNINFVALLYGADHCYYFSRYEVVKDLPDISIKVFLVKRGEGCYMSTKYIRPEIIIELLDKGTYDFHFRQSETTFLDTVIKL